MKYEYERLLPHTLRTWYVYREEELVLVRYATYLCTHATYLCTKKTFHRMLVTLRAARLGELSQRLPSIRTFVRPNKRNGSRWRHCVKYIVPYTLLLAVLYIALARDLIFHTNLESETFRESFDILDIIY